MSQNHDKCIIEDCWKEFERVGELSHSNADNALDLINMQAEQIGILRDALTEIAKLPEVRMDEGQYLARRALEQTYKD